MSKVLSLDTSSKITGYAIYVDGFLRNYSSINKSDIKDADTRMQLMATELIYLIEMERPSRIVVEETAVTRNAQTQRMLTMILGVIYGVCIKHGILYCSFRPAEWRKAVREADEKLPRKRKELKKWSINKVSELFGLQDIGDDISDAILIGKAYLNINKE